MPDKAVEKAIEKVWKDIYAFADDLHEKDVYRILTGSKKRPKDKVLAIKSITDALRDLENKANAIADVRWGVPILYNIPEIILDITLSGEETEEEGEGRYGTNRSTEMLNYVKALETLVEKSIQCSTKASMPDTTELKKYYGEKKGIVLDGITIFIKDTITQIAKVCSPDMDTKFVMLQLVYYSTIDYLNSCIEGLESIYEKLLVLGEGKERNAEYSDIELRTERIKDSYYHPIFDKIAKLENVHMWSEEFDKVIKEEYGIDTYVWDDIQFLGRNHSNAMREVLSGTESLIKIINKLYGEWLIFIRSVYYAPKMFAQLPRFKTDYAVAAEGYDLEQLKETSAAIQTLESDPYLDEAEKKKLIAKLENKSRGV